MSKLGFNWYNDIITQKGTVFANDNYIIVFHYETCVLEYDIKNKQVLSINPCSVTTTKAITQVKNYFGLEFDTKKENERLREMEL